ncbi:prepilin-type N-terminal cleavage/methylation domain-containing protein [Curtobacterium flaccumfaciens pv. flaccumfaciens]|uniref:type IV pilus modification PilV family protein n=1 Tax=Curtobacterium flaccumfaciens TaxID=2035 RepID=UPI001BDEE250|nr:prepilin-type N-terminal cleavage/methylation domain-containing protein [Curtobacterium flaccumfaciens]MBT1667918.1 prepilin-type N-terminal cleavage/methylation domain-containing protein [Curtobacterium flaccumfaciens pv. flaccumfaciens]
MFQRLHDRLYRHDAEAGFSIIEVMVAMMVFAVMSIGIAYGIANSLQLTQTNRGRETAVALASQDIDTLRQTAAASTGGIFRVLSKSGPDNTKTIGGVEYAIDRKVSWVQSDGATGACGTSNGKLAYKSVVETVTWPNPRGGSSTTSVSSAIAPSDAVTDPGYGTVIISVTTASGAPYEGVGITITPVSGGGGAALTAAVLPTDAQGCSYAVNVSQGDYAVSASVTGGIDTNQQQPSVQSPISVTAGASSPVPFVYDQSSQLTLQYAAGSKAMIPTNMPTTLSSTAGGLDVVKPWDLASTSLNITSSSQPSLPVFPFASGYTVYAGPYSNSTGSATSCLSPNPSSWSTPNAANAIGVSPPSVATAPGKPSSASVMMGVATVTGVKDRYITAVSSANPAAGDPGCAAGMTMRFPVSTGDTATIALPFGTWTLYSGTTFGSTTKNEIASKASNVKPVTNGMVNQKTALVLINYDNTLTLDPRGQTS